MSNLTFGLFPGVTKTAAMENFKDAYKQNVYINDTLEKFSTLHTAQRVTQNYITPAICVLGFLGNLINIVVLSKLRQQRKDGARDRGTHLGLIVLAVSDLLFCLAVFPRGFVPESSSLFSERHFSWFYQVTRPFCSCLIHTRFQVCLIWMFVRKIHFCCPQSGVVKELVTFQDTAAHCKGFKLLTCFAAYNPSCIIWHFVL